MSEIVFLIPLFPLLGFLITGIGSRSLPRKVTAFLAPGMILISFALSVFVFFNLQSFSTSLTRYLSTSLTFFFPLNLLKSENLARSSNLWFSRYVMTIFSMP